MRTVLPLVSALLLLASGFALGRVTADVPAVVGGGGAAPVGALEVPRRGAAAPKVIFASAIDFGCGYCAKMAPHIERIALDWPDSVQVRTLQLPLSPAPEQRGAARAAVAAAHMGGYEDIEAALFRLGAHPSDAELAAAAEAAALDPAELVARAQSEEAARAVDAQAKAARKLGASGTPTFFINGIQVQGRLPYPVIQAVVRDQIRRFDLLTAEGLTPAEALVELIRRQSSSPAAAIQLLAMGEAPAVTR
jgi:protein-disulfide isomerase